jgi:hypothetical protein
LCNIDCGAMELTDSPDNDCKEGSEEDPSSKSTKDANPMAMLLPSEINEFLELYGIRGSKRSGKRVQYRRNLVD